MKENFDLTAVVWGVGWMILWGLHTFLTTLIVPQVAVALSATSLELATQIQALVAVVFFVQTYGLIFLPPYALVWWYNARMPETRILLIVNFAVFSVCFVMVFCTVLYTLHAFAVDIPAARGQFWFR